MTLVVRQVLAVVGTVFLTATVSLFVEREVIRRQGIELTKETMRSTLLSAENTRSAISKMRKRGTFDDARLGAEASGRSDFRETAIYDTVPVVAAWNSVSEMAKVQGYQFRIPANNPRNATNQPNKEESEILAFLESSKDGEYFTVDEDRREIVLARTIRLTEDCMLCHGQPSSSARSDGKDLLGFRMEGWRVGDAHGAFVLRSSLDRVDAVVRAGIQDVAIWVIPLSFLFGAFAYWLSARGHRQLTSTLSGVTEGAERVLVTSLQIAESSSSLADGVDRQASALQSTTTAGRELQIRTRNNTESSERAVRLTEDSDHRVAEAQNTLRQMQDAMDGIAVSSDKIGKIIQVIDGLAFQTNILALNAAVEAARAGHAGLGFAVVADEVRSLAQRSAQAARDTAALIEESLQSTSSGNAQLVQVKQAFRSLGEEFHAIREAVSGVRDDGSKQLVEIDRILDAVRELESITNDTSRHAQEGASVAKSLNEEAGTLQETVKTLTELAR